MDKDILRVKKLRTKKFREETGLVIVEGAPEVSRAMQAEVPFEIVYVCEELLTQKIDFPKSYRRVDVAKEVFAEMAFGSRLKGVLAICRPINLTLNDLNIKDKSIILIVEGVEKPGNIGTILRTCDGAGVNAVLFCDTRTDIYNQHVVRSSIGAVFSVPFAKVNNLSALNFLKEKGKRIYAATAHAKDIYTDCDFSQGAAIAVGNEHSGLSPFWTEHADQLIKIPMEGVSSSLNVSVSASILAYEAKRKVSLVNT